MKSLILVAILFSAKVSFACSPPPNAWIQDKWELSQLLGSSELTEKLGEVDAKSITNIEISSGKYTISVGTPCQIVAKPVYERPSHQGMCPSFKGFEMAITCSPQD